MTKNISWVKYHLRQANVFSDERQAKLKRRIVAYLWIHGDDDEPVTSRKMEADLDVRQPTINTVINELKRSHIVRSYSGETDTRGAPPHYYELTDEWFESVETRIQHRIDLLAKQIHEYEYSLERLRKVAP